MRIVTMPVSGIAAADYNPRVQLSPGDPEWERLAAIIDEYGLVEPLVWNERTNRLVGGHQRLAILRHRGDTDVEVSVVDLDEEREVALNLALNNPNAQSRWDPHKLVAVAESMSAEAIRLAGYDGMGDVHEIMRRHELMRTGSFMSDFLQPEQPPELAGAPITSPPSPEQTDGEESEGRGVEIDMKEPHKHLSGEQYFEIKLVFDGPQRDLWLRFTTLLKREQSNDNTFEVLIQHASDYLADGNRNRIDEGIDTL
jgi:ParB/Sulfiredoxin domain